MCVDYLYKYNMVEIMRELDIDSFPFSIKTKTGIEILFFNNEKFSWKALISRLFFFVCTKGKVKIVCAFDDEKVIHTSFVIPKCKKFAFLDNNDYEIGPCKTDVNYRGKGIYPYVLKHIVETSIQKDCDYYMIVNEMNVSSRRGCEKAGFTIINEVVRSKYFRVWKIRGEK